MFDAAVLDVLEPRELDDWALVEAIQAWERLASRVAAGQAAALAELTRRRPRDLLDRPAGHVDRGGGPALPEISEFAVDEVAAALRLSRPAAGARLHLAVELIRLPGTAAALRGGRTDAGRARAVVDAVSVLDDPTALAVEARLLLRDDDGGRAARSTGRSVAGVNGTVRAR